MRDQIRLISTAGTGHFYVTKKNQKTATEKLVLRKYDPKARRVQRSQDEVATACTQRPNIPNLEHGYENRCRLRSL